MLKTLSERQKQVLVLLAEGLPNKLIADRLGVSFNTAKFHVDSVIRRLGVATRTEAAVMYIQAKAFEEGFAAGLRAARNAPDTVST